MDIFLLVAGFSILINVALGIALWESGSKNEFLRWFLAEARRDRDDAEEKMKSIRKLFKELFPKEK